MNSYNEIEVYMYDKKVGTLMQEDHHVVFYYSARFKASNIEISPIMLDTKKIVGGYINSSHEEIYQGLPGIIKDSLPDSNGEKVMDKYFLKKGLDLNKVGLLHRLAFIGDRGMGALEYRPKEHDDTELSEKVIDAKDLYVQNRILMDSDGDFTIDEIMARLIDSASPVGGAKEKTLICFNPDSKTLRLCNSNYTDNEGYIPCLLKFDSEKEYKKETTIEYIYMKLARLAGLEVMDFYLLDDGNKKHYITQRYDRIDGKKIHTATVSALLHTPHMRDGITYEQLIKLGYELTKNMEEVKKIIRQVVFNIIMAVTDDHAKNFSFMMDENGSWKYAPSYDLIYGYGTGALKHKTSISGKNRDIDLDDILNALTPIGIEEDYVLYCIVDVIEIFNIHYSDIADEVGLDRANKDAIEHEINSRIKRISV